ncbi:MAG TPA: type II toxin-antitoxin system prevent-host-death family antitoxin [Chloroflexota bacterium]|nr:type II toxin-antitoxin system prevent-host-death family antitoxin [Chloroflexota bacterium]
METATGIPSIEFSEAKSRLSDVMSAVVHEHQPRLISRHRGKESMVLLPAEDLAVFLRQYRFEAEIIFSDGEVTAQLPRFDLLGFGATIDEALDDLLSELRAYVTRFFDRSSFYMQSERREHWPWLMRFALTPSDEQRLLLIEPPERPVGK